MSLIISWILSLVVAGPAPHDMSLLVWSDLHGDPSPRLFAWVDSLRRDAEQWKRPVLALDAGDAFFGSDLSFLTRGRAQASLYNFVKPDAIVLGAQDFAWTRARLDSVLSGLKTPVLGANLRNAMTDKPYGGTDWKIWNFDSLLVGVVGATDADISSADRPSRTIDLRSDDPENSVADAVAELRQKKAAIVVVLSHAGEEADRAMAEKIQGIDLIAGSRDDAKDTLYKVGKCWIARVGGGGRHLSRIELKLDGDGSVEAEAKSSDIPSVDLSATWKPYFDSLARWEKSRLDSAVGTLAEGWPRTKREGALGNFLADALREGSGADVALFPASAIQAGLPKGRVTVGQVWKTLGGFSQVSVFELPGSELKRLIRNQLFHAKDFLFLSGASCTSDNSATGGAEGQVLVGGKPIQGSDRYKVAIPQSLRENIYDLTGFSLASCAPQYLERWDRDIVLEHIGKVGFKTSLGRVPAMYGSSH